MLPPPPPPPQTLILVCYRLVGFLEVRSGFLEVRSEPEAMVSPLCLVWQHVKLSDVSLGTRPLYSLDVEEDVNKSIKQSALSCCFFLVLTDYKFIKKDYLVLSSFTF